MESGNKTPLYIFIGARLCNRVTSEIPLCDTLMVFFNAPVIKAPETLRMNGQNIHVTPLQLWVPRTEYLEENSSLKV